MKSWKKVFQVSNVSLQLMTSGSNSYLIFEILMFFFFDSGISVYSSKDAFPW